MPAKLGFAVMSPERRRAIAHLGGKESHRQGKAHQFTPEEARAAGKKGGAAVSQSRAHMAAIGRKGGGFRGYTSPLVALFPLGSRVQVSLTGLLAGRRKRSLLGTVKGYTRDGKGLKILRDGCRSLQPYPAVQWELLPAEGSAEGTVAA